MTAHAGRINELNYCEDVVAFQSKQAAEAWIEKQKPHNWVLLSDMSDVKTAFADMMHLNFMDKLKESLAEHAIGERLEPPAKNIDNYRNASGDISTTIKFSNKKTPQDEEVFEWLIDVAAKNNSNLHRTILNVLYGVYIEENRTTRWRRKHA